MKFNVCMFVCVLPVRLHLIKNIEHVKNRVHVHTFHKGMTACGSRAVSAPTDPNSRARGAQPFSMIFFIERLVYADARSGRNDEKELVPSSDIVCKEGGDARCDEYKCLRRGRGAPPQKETSRSWDLGLNAENDL